jgi:hypothetical protein
MFTPNPFRRSGIGNVCVANLTELLPYVIGRCGKEFRDKAVGASKTEGLNDGRLNQWTSVGARNFGRQLKAVHAAPMRDV